MSEMIERAAMALFEFTEVDWKERSSQFRYVATQDVRRMIAAMREPTEAMHHSARDWSAAKYGKPIGNDASLGCWQSMIDAALK
jgi:hypothetical protein